MDHIEFIHKKRHKNLILFIHGFTGGPETWSHPNKADVSFPSMLKNEKEIGSNFDIATINYYTKMVSFEKPKIAITGFLRSLKRPSKIAYKNVGISELSNLLKTIIDFNCHEYENMVVIAHSMGGLVAKSYILNQLNNGSCKVKLFISLAVPHNGVDWATMGAKLYKKNDQLIDLATSSSTLNDINNRWVQQKVGLPHIVYFYGQSDRVVPKENAIGLQQESQDIAACSDDHFTICKPQDSNDLVYRGVKQKILTFLQQLNLSQEQDKTAIRETVNYDNEIFILKLLISNVHDKLVANAKDRFFDAEYMKRLLASQNIDLNKLNSLYDKIEQIYINEFVNYSNKKVVSSDELIQKIYAEIIAKDKDFLKSFTPIIGELEKMGMLHQLANNTKKEIWWDEGQSMEQINRLKDDLSK
jgi:hypothetical protein